MRKNLGEKEREEREREREREKGVVSWMKDVCERRNSVCACTRIYTLLSEIESTKQLPLLQCC